MSVALETIDHTAIVTIDRPEQANSIDLATGLELSRTFDRLADDDQVRAVVLTGAGERVFCAGMDLGAVQDGQADAINGVPGGFGGIVQRDFAKPVVAAVNGAAIGGGFEIVLACDLVVAVDTARFALPEVTIGLYAASGGAVRLALRLPPARAMEHLLLGTPLSAPDAHALGLVNRVVPREQLRAAAVELAAAVAANAPLAVAASKRIARTAMSRGEEAAWALNAELAPVVTTSSDAAEGTAAARGRRPPRWSGR